MTRLRSAQLEITFCSALVEPVKLSIFAQQPKNFHIDKDKKFILVLWLLCGNFDVIAKAISNKIPRQPKFALSFCYFGADYDKHL